MGAEEPGVDNPRRSDSASSLQTIGAIFSAVQSITSTKWAEEGVQGRAATVSDDLDTARAEDGTIPWDAVERHCTASSCWIVVKDKVRALWRWGRWREPLHRRGSVPPSHRAAIEHRLIARRSTT